MPGPVSDSYDPPERSVKDEWLAYLKQERSKFFVLKCVDFLECLSAEEVIIFNVMLKKHEEYREAQGKPPTNRYWVVNRDEPYADQVKRIIEQNEGIVLGPAPEERAIYAAGYFDPLTSESLGFFHGPSPDLATLRDVAIPDPNTVGDAFIVQIIGENYVVLYAWDEEEQEWGPLSSSKKIKG